MSSSNLVLRTIYISPTLDDRLRDQAYSKRTSKNDLIRQYIEAGMKFLGAQEENTQPAAKKTAYKAVAKKAPAKKAAYKMIGHYPAAKKLPAFDGGVAAKKVAAKKSPAKKAAAKKSARRP